jgi:hypothetical protein
MTKFDQSVWGPHYWFFLHTIAYTYPEIPNDVSKRKYYDLLINFPLFIPNEKMGMQFATLMDKYPFVPYLDKRDSLIRWVNFIHNKINIQLKKPEIPLLQSLDDYLLYYHNSKTPDERIEKIYYMDLLVYFILIMVFCAIIYYTYMHYK